MNQNHAPFYQTVFVEDTGQAHAAPPGKIPNWPTPEGRELGEHLATYADQEAAKRPGMRLRCATCAFRRGTMANGCAATLMDATKLIFEKGEFDCHERPGPCAGAALLARGEEAPALVIPWPLSND